MFFQKFLNVQIYVWGEFNISLPIMAEQHFSKNKFWSNQI